MTHRSLSGSALRRPCDPALLGFETTADLDDLDEAFGQRRAVEATELSVAIDQPGYNLFVMGPSGAGKHATIRALLEDVAARRSTPDDWVYVQSFARLGTPKALSLPAGLGCELAGDMQRIVEDLRAGIIAAFESEEYTGRVGAIQTRFKERHEEIFTAIESEGRRRGVAVLRSPAGFMFAPLKEGEVVPPTEADKLSAEEREQARAAIAALQQRLSSSLEALPQIHKEAREAVKTVDREVAAYVVEHALGPLRDKYAELPRVVEYLEEVRGDVAEHVDDFRSQEDDAPTLLGKTQSRRFRRYSVNVLVDHSAKRGAPVVYDDVASHGHLVGRAEHFTEFGTLMTDFTLIKPGALHRANGGFLLLDARTLLSQPHAWNLVKRSLFSKEIRIEPLAQLLGLSTAESLNAEPIPLSVKVVLFGPRELYYLLARHDPDFLELFKVEADFEDAVERDERNEEKYARRIARLTRKFGHRPLDAAAVARCIEESARYADDSSKLATNSRVLVDLLEQSNHWAGRRDADVIGYQDVDRALAAQIAQRDRIRDRVHEAIGRGKVLLEVDGLRTAQVNGLAAIALGGFAFGRPTRITGTVRVGDGRVVDIEREVELGGPLHTKGVLILSNYLASRYARDYPLSLAASVVFEQSYSGVEGDSASLAELCVLLSALAGAPLDQGIAVTGSVNQRGQVQAVGAVNEKVEGYFDVCRMLGTTGRQGVIVPAANVDNLMLRPDVVEAVENGQFRVVAASTVDEALEILTGLTAGEADADGQFPSGTFNALVQQQLLRFAVLAKRFGEAVLQAEAETETETESTADSDDEVGEADADPGAPPA